MRKEMKFWLLIRIVLNLEFFGWKNAELQNTKLEFLKAKEDIKFSKNDILFVKQTPK